MTTPRDRLEARLGLAGPPLQPVRDTPPRIPDHELIRRIGQGAYGEVWLARNAIGTWRAVKIVFRDNFKDARPYEREFAGIRRFEPLSRSNEGFVDVLQVGRFDPPRRDKLRESQTPEPELGGGWFYYVMELADCVDNPKLEIRDPKDIQTPKSEEPSAEVDVRALDFGLPSDFGPRNSDLYQPRTLARDLHHRGRLPLEDCLELGLTLTLALGHLHRHGLIHRDIKPSNIIFVGGVPKLADIGLVTDAQGANTFVGTEGFVPPEGPTSPQADLYALGKVLYEAAMGKDRNEFPEPFTQIGTDRESIALMELNAVLLRACAPDPRQRYASAEAMHADLALLHSGGSVKRRHQFDRQFQIAKQVGAVAIAATLLIGAALIWQRQQTQKMTRLAEEKSTLATEKAKLADDLTRLDAENRNRIVRLDIANGIRLLDEGDPAGALLWFAAALPLLTNNPAEESIHRIRIQQTLNQMPRPLQVLVHEHSVSALAFSPDGKRFATGTESGSVHLWDTRTGAPLLSPLHFEGGQIRQLCFTPEGQRLLVSTVVSGGNVTSARSSIISAAVLDVASGRRLFSKVATNLVRAEFIADGRWLVTVEPDHVLRLLDVQNGNIAATLKGHTASIVSLSASAQGNLLTSASEDETIRLWRLPSGEQIGSPLPFHPPQHGPVLSADGRRLATREEIVSGGVTNNFIRVRNTETLRPIGEPMAAPGGSGSFAFDPAASHRLYISFGGQVRAYDVDTQRELLSPIQFEKPMGNWATTADGRRMMVGGREGIAGLWSLETGEQLAPPFRHGRQIVDVAFTPYGSQFATVTDDGACLLWNVNLQQEHTTYRFNADFPADRPLQRLIECFSPDRRRCLIILADGTVRLVDLERLAEQQLPGGTPANVEPHQCLFAPDNRQWVLVYFPTTSSAKPIVELWRDEAGVLQRQALTSATGTERAGIARTSAIVELWKDGTGRTIRQQLRDVGVHNLQFAPDSLSLITVSEDRQIRFWRTADGTLANSVEVPDTILAGDLFPDGRTALVLDRSSGFALFDLATSRILPTAIGPSTITALEFDPRGERFTTATEQQWARVWSMRTGAALSPEVRHDGAVTWLEWSPDGKRIAMTGLTPEVRVWDAASGELSLPSLRLGNQALQTVMWSLDGRFLVARSDENLVRVWDAATGEPVTPLLKHNSFVRLAHLVANNRLTTLSLPNVMRAWDLTETKLPADVIADYGRLAAGRRLNATGVMLPLKPDELAELHRSLRARVPELFE